jgi:hypothetical protein
VQQEYELVDEHDWHSSRILIQQLKQLVRDERHWTGAEAAYASHLQVLEARSAVDGWSATPFDW